MIDRAKLNTVERDLVEGLEEFVNDLKRGAPIEKENKCRQVNLDIERQAHTGKDSKNSS